MSWNTKGIKAKPIGQGARLSCYMEICQLKKEKKKIGTRTLA